MQLTKGNLFARDWLVRHWCCRGSFLSSALTVTMGLLCLLLVSCEIPIGMNYSTCIGTLWTISSFPPLPPSPEAAMRSLKSVLYVCHWSCSQSSLVVPWQEDNKEIGSPNKMWPRAVPILLSSRWLYLPSQYSQLSPYCVCIASPQTTASYAATVWHYHPYTAQFCQALSNNYQGGTAAAETLLVVNMHLMWAANYIIWVAHCYSWCRSKRGLQGGDFNTSNNQRKIRISLLSNLFHRIFSVQVDEDKVQTQRLPSDLPISVKKLFVGGTSSQFHTAPLRSIPPFEGCIWNLVINAT